MNLCVICGRLVRDPEVRYSQAAEPMAIARYTIAVDRRGRRNQDADQTADFISCVAFGKNGEFAEKYFRQGMRVLIRGHIQTGNYTNKDGVKVYTTDVIVDEQEFADSKGSTGGNTEGGFQPTSRPTPANAMPMGDGFMNIPSDANDDGVPFN